MHFILTHNGSAKLPNYILYLTTSHSKLKFHVALFYHPVKLKMGTSLQFVFYVTGKKDNHLDEVTKFSEVPLHGLGQSSLSKAIHASPAHHVLPKNKKQLRYKESAPIIPYIFYSQIKPDVCDYKYYLKIMSLKHASAFNK